MTLRIEVRGPGLTSGPLVLYETGEQGLIFGRPGAISRRVDIYSGRDVLASGGSWTTTLHDPDGLFAPDGLFGQDWREVTITAAIDTRLVFVGRADQILTPAGGAGQRTQVRWRDLVDNFLAQPVDGVDPDQADLRIVARTTLASALRRYGIVPRTPPPALGLWLPERTSTLRQWLWPVLAALGYELDWAGTVIGDTLATGIYVAEPDGFGNTSGAGLPVFFDQHLVSTSPRIDHGREQVVNLWSGRRRFWDAAEMKFDREDVNAYGSLQIASLAVASRSIYGARRARMDLSQIDELLGTIRGIADRLIGRRLWPHARAEFLVRGRDAADLHIGDGFVTGLAYESTLGRGLSRVWRVIGHTLDMERETVKLYAEARDGRDADYRRWRDAGAGQFEAATD